MSESELSDAADFSDWMRRAAKRMEETLVSDARLAEMMEAILGSGGARDLKEHHAFEQVLERTGTDAFVAVRELVRRRNPAAIRAERAADLYGLPVFNGLRDHDAGDNLGRHLKVVSDEPSDVALGTFHRAKPEVEKLLMGVQLYGDAGLALRELYQNALDACRYRVARYEYLSRTSGDDWSYEPEITFRHGRDEQGRDYLDCADNGVGMDVEVIRELFSRAGARFVESQNYRAELTDWKVCDPPVELVPNSRFGIGVLSYFMLADQIEVTTCRMDRHGRSGPELRLAIGGAGQLYRIAQVRERGEPGTTVRLLLRESSDRHGWSEANLAKSLERVLGVAEFPTSFVGKEARLAWIPGELRPSRSLAGQARGVRADGWTVPCLQGRVVWCEDGGALLLDGLLVEPGADSRILEGSGYGTLRGVVVNLPAQPELELSVDRSFLRSDVSAQVEAMLSAAADELVAAKPALVTTAWLADIDRHCPVVAEAVRAALDRRKEGGPNGQLHDGVGNESE
uniref:hypothetical protein n=1 Tax=Streptomyces sp. SP17BM10 TaxID=3002530 RepID=UPI002E786B24|nr:hypothetical protein [Streptomyces sp. SP17BM10]MEE1786990.1 hypothetical protein [Streptomyces sp. SP17BM10]